jgi:ABC-type Fe3+-hydroxamate transport system substrate-binding protein
VNFTAWKMKAPILLILLTALAMTGCASNKPKVSVKAKSSAPAAAKPPLITPDYSLAAKVVSVNGVGRFVVLSFPVGSLPKLEQTLFLYRNDLKSGEVRVTGPQQDSNIVADLVSGDAQVGDTVSEK